MTDEEFEAAKARFQRLRQERPDDGEVWFQFACFLEDESRNPELAVKAFEKAQQLLPDQDLRLFLGRAYAKAGSHEKGVTMIRNYVMENPTEYGYSTLADALKRAKKYEEAWQALEAAVRIDPDFDELYLLMGETLQEHAREKAIQRYREAIARDPDYERAWRNLGSALIEEEGSLEEGLDALRKAISLDPNGDDVWALVFLANGLFRAGRFVEAARAFWRGVEMCVDGAEFDGVRLQLLRVLAKQGEHPENRSEGE